MIVVLIWCALFGIWPLADPGHDDLTSLLVWLDLTVHWAAMWFLLERYIQRRIRKAQR